MSSSTPSTPGSEGTASFSGHHSSATSTHSLSLAPTSTFPQPSSLHGVTLGSLVNASVTVVPAEGPRPRSLILFGGFEQYSYEVFNELYRLDLDGNKWYNVIYTKGVPPSKRNDHSASLWRGDKLIVFGGNDDADRHCNDVILLDTKTLTWSRPEIRGPVPTGRVKHSATVYNNKLYIAGGCTADGIVTSDMNILDLETWEWQPPVPFAARHSHVSCVFQNRLYLYGGYVEEMDRASNLSFIDLDSLTVTRIEIHSDVSPSPSGQHFAQLCGHHLVVVITHCLKHGVQEPSSGIWSLDLRSMQWRQHENGARFETASWHYFAMAEHDRKFYLFGTTEDAGPDEYLSGLLVVDLEEHGILPVPEPQLGSDFGAMLESDVGIRSADYTILSADRLAPPIRVHRFLLLARWPHFASLQNSGMVESREDRLVIPEPYSTVRAFISYLYTDSISTFPTDTVADLLVLANMYLMPRLSALCCDVLHRCMRVENVSRIYHQASLAGENGLKQKALKFMFVHYGPVSRTNAFRNLPKEALLDFWDHTPSTAVIVAVPEEGGIGSSSSDGMAVVWDASSDGMAV
ncbi:hypothetical protein BC938DRAFT_476659, partial [Jimgerdemannia flammicorona]